VVDQVEHRPTTRTPRAVVLVGRDVGEHAAGDGERSLEVLGAHRLRPRGRGSPVDGAPVRTLLAVSEEPRHRNAGENMLDGLSRLGMLGLLLAPVAVVVWAFKKLRRRAG
jgi:hypothetical protein